MKGSRTFNKSVKTSDEILHDYLQRIDQLDLTKIINDFNLYDKQLTKIHSHYGEINQPHNCNNLQNGTQRGRRRQS